MATYTPVELYQGVLGASVVSVIGAVANKTIIKEIFLCNLTATDVNVEIAKLLNGETVPADKNWIAKGTSIVVPANSSKQITLSVILETGGSLFMGASAGSSIAANINGVSVTA